MRSGSRFLSFFMVAVVAGLSVGCDKSEQLPPKAAHAPDMAGSWQAVMPEKFAALPVKDGGACFLDSFNQAPIVDAPIAIKSGSPASFAGWAVADLKDGREGSAVGIQLNGDKPYFIGAARYKRPGLGTALKGSPSLDEGGLNLDATPLNVPAGDYRVFVLIQSDVNLFRCDTGRTLRIE